MVDPGFCRTDILVLVVFVRGCTRNGDLDALIEDPSQRSGDRDAETPYDNLDEVHKALRFAFAVGLPGVQEASLDHLVCLRRKAMAAYLMDLDGASEPEG